MTADRIVRAMTDDGAFRVLVLRSTDTVRGVLEAQQVRGPAAAHLAAVVTGSVLIRETMAPGQRVQVLLRDARGNQLIGDANPDGGTRGLARVRDEVLGVQLADGGMLQVVRRMPGGRQHEGIIEAGPEETMADVLVRYFLQSEQVHSMVGLDCVIRDDQVVAAGGYVVQLLPELTEPPLARMRQRLVALGDLGDRLAAADADPERLLADLLGDSGFSLLAESPVVFACTCDTERAVAAVSALPQEEIRELADSGESLAVTCDYCRTRYRVGPDRIRGLLRPGGGS